MIGEWPDSDRWSKWHYRAGVRFSQPDFSVIGVHVDNAGDGIKVKDGAGGAAQGFDVEGSWVQHVHDDCIENDYVHTGVIHDNLLDGCYVVFSSRPSSSRLDGRRNLVRIDHNVAALEPMTSVYSGPSPGTGGFFKWSDQAPPVVLTDNVFFAAPGSQSRDPRSADGWAGLRPQRDRVDRPRRLPVRRNVARTLPGHRRHDGSRPVRRMRVPPWLASHSAGS